LSIGVAHFQLHYCSPFKHLYFSEIQNYRIRDLFDAEVDFRRKSDILRYEVYL